jgi:TATA-binding protein-associated factor
MLWRWPRFEQVDDYKVPVQLNQTLRPYQQEGVNWLAFLRRFHLHGVLCDDMVPPNIQYEGLGFAIERVDVGISAASDSSSLTDPMETPFAAGTLQGLGKTLQATCIIASTHAEQRAAFQAGTGPKPLPSLVVCPPTLVAHWADEVEKYLVNKDEVRGGDRVSFRSLSLGMSQGAGKCV